MTFLSPGDYQLEVSLDPLFTYPQFTFLAPTRLSAQIARITFQIRGLSHDQRELTVHMQPDNHDYSALPHPVPATASLQIERVCQPGIDDAWAVVVEAVERSNPDKSIFSRGCKGKTMAVAPEPTPSLPVELTSSTAIT